jgi:uncharacterized CHY-type Zn-finger protein
MTTPQSVHNTEVHGIDVTPRTGCAHYHGELDIIAIRFKCCDRFFACWHCHDALAGHPPLRWQPQDLDQPAILCGACGCRLTIRQYLGCDSLCPSCGESFNPRCRLHHPLYFELPEGDVHTP